MSLGGPRRPTPPQRDSGDVRRSPNELRQRATPGLVPAPLIGMAGASIPADERQRGPSGADDPIGAHQALATICPYLVAEDGGWRAATPMREHRCTAVRPPAPLSDETQRRLCLADAHVTCPDYLAARQRRAAELAKDRIALDQLDSLRFQPTVRAVPVALERPRSRLPRASVSGRDSRPVLRAARWPLLVVAMLVVAVFGASTFLAGSAGPSASPTVRASSSAIAGGSPTGTASPGPSASSRPSPSGSPGASASPPVAARTYQVKRGDSLGKIARMFGTTVAVLKALNNMKDPVRIRIGQVLKIP